MRVGGLALGRFVPKGDARRRFVVVVVLDVLGDVLKAFCPVQGMWWWRCCVRPGQFQTGPLGLGPVIEESLGSPAKQEQGSQSDRVRTENKQQYSPGNTQNRVLSRAGLM